MTVSDQTLTKIMEPTPTRNLYSNCTVIENGIGKFLCTWYFKNGKQLRYWIMQKTNIYTSCLSYVTNTNIDEKHENSISVTVTFHIMLWLYILIPLNIYTHGEKVNRLRTWFFSSIAHCDETLHHRSCKVVMQTKGEHYPFHRTFAMRQTLSTDLYP